MKKLILLIPILVSCKNNYKCTCNYNDGTNSFQVTTEYKEVKKSYAKQACTDRTETTPYGNTNYTTCKLQ